MGIFVLTPALKSRTRDQIIHNATGREIPASPKNNLSQTLSENSYGSGSPRWSSPEVRESKETDAGDVNVCSGNEFHKKRYNFHSDSHVDQRGYESINTGIDSSNPEFLKLQDSAELSNSEDNAYHSFYAHYTFFSSSSSDATEVRKPNVASSISRSEYPYYTELFRTSQSSRLRAAFEALDIDETPYVVVNVVPTYERKHILLKNRPINLMLLSLIFVAHSFPHTLMIMVCFYLRMGSGSRSQIPSALVYNTSALADIIKIQSKHSCRFDNFTTIGLPTSGSRSLQNCLIIYLRYIKTLEIFSETLSLTLILACAGVLPHVLMPYISQWRSVGVQTLPRSQWWFGVGQPANIRYAKIQCTLELDERMRLHSNLWIKKYSQIFSEHDDANFDDSVG
ncbi:unnamed protein product [Schistocephalus solidus]|uniref:WGS project CCBQ000000000 data, contig 00015 n=1 Tax=Schistocephalus solidus TaxID=70667 RepID=A0A183SJY5_SCHSO|nr:unnamed protein product [Schistocephalus solidus]